LITVHPLLFVVLTHPLRRKEGLTWFPSLVVQECLPEEKAHYWFVLGVLTAEKTVEILLSIEDCSRASERSRR
jgi:hypothetical protein